MQTFDFPVDVGTGVELEFRTKEARFGDGYTQLVPDGINTTTETWNISWFEHISKVKPAYDFLKAHGGAKKFLWTSPLGEQIKVIARNVKLVNNGASAFTLSATFRQEFSVD